ncbi:hypothetical protein [Bacillus taeanensis]|uniref:Uncharacterized protein n=1 Tax=Bacillus taeanensis TaxID=273032 RepID=A0A366XT07_9BACI|nr:hypothetical protein [Bacillus taeanensis]RBW68688.1 hypothetical protein DS031_15130 [Bacillus taeanensis]
MLFASCMKNESAPLSPISIGAGRLKSTIPENKKTKVTPRLGTGALLLSRNKLCELLHFLIAIGKAQK